ncbi:hypothetical protein ACFWP5_08895 [Streptomyces sp. NPDC058469]|uniref:hypothetical protein n=1 Tax=Streptomyces sp. NPDC058469 TaxID=3346514 RepID=UPI00366450B9
MTGEERWALLQKKPVAKKTPKPIKQVGKVGEARAADRKAKLKAEPANHQGLRQCYIGLEWTENVINEHVIDASSRPDLRHNPDNHRYACNPHNLAKKNGTLTKTQQMRVATAVEEVLEATNMGS